MRAGCSLEKRQDFALERRQDLRQLKAVRQRKILSIIMERDTRVLSTKPEVRKFALLASGIILLSKATAYVILASYQNQGIALDFRLNAHSVVFSWTIPILIVYFVERRKAGSLGLTPGLWPQWLLVSLAALLVLFPALLFGFGRDIINQVLEQILFIALAEEVLWRGYFQKRVSEWIGSHKGIIFSSIIFGLGHIISIHAQEGYLIPRHAVETLVQTTMGGLIFGYLFHWSKSIWPSAILHLFGNVFLFRLF
jgi:membrane protease YdiL (CAAX protease family)